MTVQREPTPKVPPSTTAWRRDRHYSHSGLTCLIPFYEIGCGGFALREIFRRCSFKFECTNKTETQRVLWYDKLTDRNVTEYRFTRVIFGATSSPYILVATLQKHIRDYEEEFTVTAQSLLEDTYVDDIHGGGDSEADAVTFKEESTKILSEGGFSLHKWHSNVEHVNSSGEVHEGEETYAKSMVGNKQSNKTKILGTQWNKKEDTLTIDLETCLEIIKPLKMISTINSIYDILGWSAPVTITAKLIFSEVCLLKIYWDEEVPSGIQKKCESWVKRPSPFHAASSRSTGHTSRYTVLRMPARLLFVL